MSMHKYASNVIEKCVVYGKKHQKDLIFDEICFDNDSKNILCNMMKDMYANYVIQKSLEYAKQEHLDVILKTVRENSNTLRKFTYGRHIVAFVEKMMFQYKNDSN